MCLMNGRAQAREMRGKCLRAAQGLGLPRRPGFARSRESRLRAGQPRWCQPTRWSQGGGLRSGTQLLVAPVVSGIRAVALTAALVPKMALS